MADVMSCNGQIQMQGDIKKIQTQLNKLCSQHDELMALLDIYDYMPNLKQLQQTNRNITSKINNFQHQIQQLLQANSSVKIREDIHLKMKQEEFKVNIEATELQLRDLNTKIQLQRAVITKLEEGRVSSNNILEVKEKIKLKLNKMLQDFEDDVGNLLAKQMLTLKQNKRFSGKQKEVLIEKSTTEESYNYQKLMHEIELQLLQLEPPSLAEYFQFTYTELKRQILQVNSKAQNHQVDEISSEIGQQQRELITIRMALLNKLGEQLQYRVIALKRFSGQQLLILYEECDEKMAVNELQKSIKEKLRQLQHLIVILKSNTSLEADYDS